MIKKAYKLKDLWSINFALGPGFVLIPGGLRRLTSLARGASNLFLLAYPPVFNLPISTTLLSQTRFPDRGLFTQHTRPKVSLPIPTG
jgi:hypothetical protein